MNEIPLETLPEKFVVKTNHWSGNNVFCQDKKSFNRKKLNDLEGLLQRKYGTSKAEWPYWHIKPKILVEEYLEDPNSRLIDYKFFCFNGQPKFLVAATDRDPITGISAVKLYFDLNWKFLPFWEVGFPNKESIPQPESLDHMIENCRILCKGLPFVRADFYDILGQCRFGELTLPEPIRNPQFAYSPSP